MTSIRFDLQEQIDKAMHEAKTKLRTEFTAMLNRKVVSLEARVEARINEVRQGTTSLLEDLKATVAEVGPRQLELGKDPRN